MDRHEVYLGAARPVRDRARRRSRPSTAASRLLALPGRATARPGARRAARSRRTWRMRRWTARARAESGWRSRAGEEEGDDDGEPLEVPGRPSRRRWTARLLDLPRRAARRGRPPHRADRQAAGASGEPRAGAGPAARRRGPAPEHARQPDEGARSSSCARRAPAAQGAARPALRRVGLDGSLQPLPAPVPLRAAERLRPRGDLHVRHAAHPGHRASQRCGPIAGAAPAHRGARLVGGHADRRVAPSSTGSGRTWSTAAPS